MLFNSTAFIIFIFAVTLLYYLVPLIIKKQGVQSWILILSGLFFYAYLNLFYALSLLICCIFNELIVLGMHGFYQKQNKKGIKILAGSAIAVNVFILFFFKYSGMFATLLLGEGELTSFFIGLPLPLGISFYIFHAISMLADINGNSQIFFEKSGRWDRFVGIMCYMTFFANSVSGPVTKYNDFEPQIKRHYFKEVDLKKVFEYLLLGYFFKVCVADNMQNYTILLTEKQFGGVSPLAIMIQMFGYSCQIFADFAGYSYIAIGVALLLGYSLPQNFNFPYISKNITEFWKRWHISLSSWLKQYVYFSLGGNRKGKIRTYFNLMAVMLIGGIWHGADWKYLLWGGLHGLLLVIERIFANLTNKKRNSEKKELFAVGLIRMIITFIIVSWLWLFFKMEGYEAVFGATRQMFTGWEDVMAMDTTGLLMACFYMLPVFAFHGVYIAKEKGLLFTGKNWKYVFYAVMILSLLLNRGTSDAFIYFQY